MKAIIDRFEDNYVIVHRVGADGKSQLRIPTRLLPDNAKIGDWLNVKININNASVSELQYLDGIGPAMSKRIVKYREQHGPFERIEEIRNVQGMEAFGGDRFERIKNDITVGKSR